MRKLSINRFKILSDLGAVEDVFFPLRGRPVVTIAGKEYFVRGMDRVDLFEWVCGRE